MILNGNEEVTDSTIDVKETEETSILLKNYPFPITKGCYLTIEREYGVPIETSQKSTIQETINILLVHSILHYSYIDCSTSNETPQ